MTASPTRVLTTSLLAHALNTNAAIRTYLTEGLVEVLDAGSVATCPLETLAETVQAFRPTLIVAVGSLAVDSTDLRALRRLADRAGAVLAYWLHDDPYEFDYAFKAELYADVVFSNDAWAVEHYRHRRVHHLPLAASRAVHYRPLTPMAARDIGLFFCGVAYPNRVDLLRKASEILLRHPVVVLGADWPADLPLAVNRRLDAAGMADHAARARLTLNVGRDLSIANQRFGLPASTPGPRTFEIALSGSAQLYVVSSLEILDYFDEDAIIPVDGVRDIEVALERSLDEPEAILAIAARAQAHALDRHSYADRARRILRACADVASREAAA